jgi:hypothetical protein
MQTTLENQSMREIRSDSPTKCGLCGGEAYTPERFSNEDPAELDGCFNECGECGAECTGADARGVVERWFWTGAQDVARGRAAMEAAELDAEWAEDRRYDY